MSDGIQFVPSAFPGFDNLTHTDSTYGQPHLIIERDLEGFASLTRFARETTTDPLSMTLFFSWERLL